MSFVSAQKSRLILDDFPLSAYATKVSPNWTTQMLDTTTLADTAKQFIVGQRTSTCDIEGHLDPDGTAAGLIAELNGLTITEKPLSFAPQGFANGNEVMLVNALEATWATSSTVSNPVGFKLSTQTDGNTDFGLSLADLAAVTASGNGTSLNNGASSANGAAAHLHVSAFSGFTQVVFTVADSADNSTFATVGTFATVTGTTSERLTIAGTVRQYVRIAYTVTGTGSVTFQASIARR